MRDLMERQTEALEQIARRLPTIELLLAMLVCGDVGAREGRSPREEDVTDGVDLLFKLDEEKVTDTLKQRGE